MESSNACISLVPSSLLRSVLLLALTTGPLLSTQSLFHNTSYYFSPLPPPPGLLALSEDAEYSKTLEILLPPNGTKSLKRRGFDKFKWTSLRNALTKDLERAMGQGSDYDEEELEFYPYKYEEDTILSSLGRMWFAER